ncbi:SLATT domain-containing protein [Photorhabdus caribbeanensis]|uniref:SLATT domain-containing protein n=1 Tax=Photorhabdus caribbeanensis TaxID=1004165 RepID=UPI001BD2212B|nr:SLATT domain-containing protein [Photorhabdus caribbeanensis]
MRDNIWFTYKARINAHHRLEWMEKHSQFLLVWYAILGAVLSVITIRYPRVLGDNTDIWAAILSIVLLGVSLVVSNLDFRGRAIAMRKNYLALQKLYAEIPQGQPLTSAQIAEYNDLLGEVENHQEIDDKMARVSAHSTLTTRKPTTEEIDEVGRWKILKIVITSLLYLTPLILLWINYECGA